jgi:hypothetical protein
MIHDLTANFVSGYAALRNRASHRSSSRLEAHGVRGGEMNREYTHAAFTYTAQPEIGSLWSPGMLDQLKAPLTRYHE